MGKKPTDSAFTKTARRIEADRQRAEARASAAEKKAETERAKAAKLAKKMVAFGKLASHSTEAMLLLKEFPDLARPYLDEFAGMSTAKTGPQPPNGAAMKAARQTVLDAIADRLDEAEDEWVDLDERDTEQPDVWVCTRGVYEFVKRMIFEELFATRPKPKEPTDTPSGSPDRIEAMAQRAAAGEDIYHPQDAKAEGKKLETRERANGGGLQVLGWLTDEQEPESLRDEAARDAEKIRAKHPGSTQPGPRG